MKNQYFGDVKDYLTYGLLRLLARTSGLRIGVAWMLTPDRPDGQGELRGYLRQPGQWQAHDPVLYGLLAQVPRHGRGVELARRFNLLPGAAYFEELVPESREERQEYFRRLFFALESCPLIFFDPDIGLETRASPRGSRRSLQHLYWDEVEEAYHQKRRSLLIFQHFPRRVREEYLQERAGELARRLNVPRVDWFQASQVVFFLAARAEHAGALAGVPAAVQARWGAHIQPGLLEFASLRPDSTGQPVAGGQAPALYEQLKTPKGLDLAVLPGRLAVCRLAPDAPFPPWAGGELTALTRTSEELSIVCAQERVPAGVQAETGWRAIKVAGPLDFALVGILAGLAGSLAAAGISLFAISTYDTDYLLVKEASLAQALEALCAAGHRIVAVNGPE